MVFSFIKQNWYYLSTLFFWVWTNLWSVWHTHVHSKYLTDGSSTSGTALEKSIVNYGLWQALLHSILHLRQASGHVWATWILSSQGHDTMLFTGSLIWDLPIIYLVVIITIVQSLSYLLRSRYVYLWNYRSLYKELLFWAGCVWYIFSPRQKLLVLYDFKTSLVSRDSFRLTITR